MNPIRFSADSAADLSEDMARRLDVKTLPLYVNLKDRSFRDGIDITPAEIFHAYETEGIIPTTSAIPVGEYESHFQSLREGGAYDVLHFCMSGGLSSCFQNARAAAAGLGGVHVLDTESMTTGMVLVILHAERLRAAGLDAAAIAAACETRKKQVCLFLLLGSPTFLRKSGRCGALSALGANLLGIRPVVQMVDGLVVMNKKLRGKPQAVHRQYLDDILARRTEIDPAAAFLYHTGVEEVEELADYVRSWGLFRELAVGMAGGVACSHVGDRCLTLIFAKAGKEEN